jgi:hypothetical protein
MKKSALVFAAYSTILALPAVAPAADRMMRDGKWEITSSVEMEGMDMKIPPTTITQCFKPEDVKDPREMIHKSQPRSKDDCKPAEVKVEGNTVHWKLECEKNHMKGTGDMTYHGDTYEGTMRMEMNDPSGGGLRKVTTQIKARRIGDCS